MKKTNVTPMGRDGPLYTCEGYLFEIEGIPLVVHRSQDRGRDGTWQVTEPTTGLKLGPGFPPESNRKAAIDSARMAVLKAGVERTRSLIQNTSKAPKESK